jgi:Tfp pilus assembly protein PilO
MNFDPKNRQHLLILVAVAVVAIFLGDRFVVTPMWNGWKARSARLADLKKKVNDGEALLKRADSLRSRWSEMRTNALPADAATAESLVLRSFDRWSQSSGVSVSSIRPQWKRAGDDYMTLECRADVAGSLADVTRFLFEIEQDPLGVKVDSAALATRDTDGAQITLGLQVSGLQLISKR